MATNSFTSPYYTPQDNANADSYESSLFLRMRSLARAAFIFGIISLLVSILLPPQPIMKSIANNLVLGYSATLVLLCFLTNLAYLQQLTPLTYRQPESISNIKFWSIMESLFFGFTLFFLFKQIIGDGSSVTFNMIIASISVILVVGSSFYYQSKVWESHHRLIVTDLVDLINMQKDQKAIELLVKVYDFKIEKGIVVELPPTSSVVMLRIIWYRFAFLCISSVIALLAINLL